MRKSITIFMLLSFALIAAGNCYAQQTEGSALKKEQHWYKSEPFVFPKKNPNLKVLPLISVKGNSFVNPQGDTVLFRGLSIADPDKVEGEGHWDKNFFMKVKDMGTMLVRIPVHPIAWRERTPAAYLKLLDEAVEWCTELGMYVDIDWHSIGNLETELFQDPSYNTTRKETFEFWNTIAKHFKGNNTVAFYELFNEPTTYSNTLGPATWEEWKKINEDLIIMIRAFDTEVIPLVAPFDWAYDLTPLIISPINAEGIGYVTHPYPHKRSQPWEPKWEEDFGFAAAKYPIIATEFGFSTTGWRGEKIDTQDYGNRIVKFLESKGISWLAWVFDPDWSPQLLKSWDTYELTDSGKFFKEAMHAPKYKK